MKKSVLAAAVVALACALAGCGGEAEKTSLPSSGQGTGSSNVADASPQASQDPDDAMLNYVRCLRDNGANVPDPGPDGGLVMSDPSLDEATMQRATAACAHLLADSMDTSSQQMDSAQMDAALALAKCMRDKGHDFADPTSSQGRLQLDVPQDPQEAEAWGADLRACAGAEGK